MRLSRILAATCGGLLFLAGAIAVSPTQAATIPATGKTWGPAVPVGTSGWSVSCPDPTFCMTLGFPRSAISYDGHSWSTPVQVAPKGELVTVSCPTENFCAAVGYGMAVTFNGTRWGKPAHIDSLKGLKAVSCPTVSFCAAVGYPHNGPTSAFIFDGTGWSGPVTLGDFGGTAVSCVSGTFCVAVGGDDASFYDGSSWSDPAFIGNAGGVTSVSCATPTFCEATGQDGDMYAFDGATWTDQPISGGDPNIRPLSVSCSRVTFCIAGDNHGFVYHYNGSSWTKQHEILSGIGGLWCTVHGFCAAVDGLGNAAVRS